MKQLLISVLNFLIKRFDDYNIDFKKHNGI
jgi:hypothetical protein